MANSNKLPKSKVCDRGSYSLKASSDQSRFHQYCSRTSVFPPLPPVTTLTAAQRLKRFKAICKKQPLLGPNRVKDNTKPAKKSLGITLVVRKKGLRKSVVATPGKSPYIRSARKKTIGRKSLIQKNPPSSLKMTELETSSETFALNNRAEPFNAEHIHDLKKEVSKKLFLEERNLEQETFRLKPPSEPFVEYPDEQSSNSVEIDVVSNFNQFPTNGCVNGESNGLNYPPDNEINGHENGIDIEKPEMRNNKISDKKELKNSRVESEVIVQTDCKLPEVRPMDSYPSYYTVDYENGNIEKTEISNGHEENQKNAENSDEDASFDAVLQAPVEREHSATEETVSTEFAEAVVDEPASILMEKTDSAMFVTAEVHAEAPIDDSHKKPADENDVDVETNGSAAEISFEVANGKNKKKKFKKTSPAEQVETSPKVQAPKMKVSLKIQGSLKAQCSPKTQASPKKKPQKRRSSPARAIKPKSKKESLPSLDTTSEAEIHFLSEIERTSAPEPEVSVTQAEKEETAGPSSTSTEDPFKQSIMVRRSQLKRMEPASYSTNSEKSEKTPVSSPIDVEFAEPSTSRSLRRTQRSFSPSRRAPLRSVRRGMGTATPLESPPLKRKAETAEDSSSKRVKNEAFETPRWNFLSSPLKSYWSPQLSNKIKYKQPVTPTPERPQESSDEETPKSSESPNKSNTDKTWCTIA